MSRVLRRVGAPLAVVIALIAPLVLSAPAPAAPSDQDLINLACSLPHRYLVRTWNGFSPDRGPELTAIPQEPDFMGAGLPHVGPWDYIQHIPMFWYGPGHIKAQGETTAARSRSPTSRRPRRSSCTSMGSRLPTARR